MNILYFSRSYTPHDYRFLSAIVDHGHQAIFLRLHANHPSETRPLPHGTSSVSGDLKDVLSRVKPDLLHAGPLTDCGYMAARSGFHPIVQMSWGSDILWEAKRKLTARGRVRFALQQADVVVGDCLAVKRAVQALGVRADRIVTFPWGVDIRRFKPSGNSGSLRNRLGWQKDFILLHLRSWEQPYDPLTVVRGFLRAARQNPHLRMLMPGSGSLESKIRREIRKAGMEYRVHLPGNIPYEKLPEYFQASDLYVSASLSDGSSVSLMEALASGVPALVSDIPGNQEWVRSGKEGWLFSVRDEQTLSELILNATRSKRLGTMRKRCRKTAEDKANWKNNSLLLFKAYDKALSGVS